MNLLGWIILLAISLWAVGTVIQFLLIAITAVIGLLVLIGQGVAHLWRKLWKTL